MKRMTDDEIVKIIQARKEGKEIERRTIEESEESWVSDNEPSWDFSSMRYRVKPEPEIRPYTYEELKEAVKKHGLLVEETQHTPPVTMTILGFDGYHIKFDFVEIRRVSLVEFSKSFVWLDDGSPCGIIESDKKVFLTGALKDWNPESC